MRVLLLEHPRNIGEENINDIANAPLSSCLFTGYIAGVLKEQNHHVDIIEGYLERRSYEEIYQMIKEFKPKVLGIHMVYQWKADVELYQLLTQVKEEGLVSYITAYGYYPTFAYEEIFRECSILDTIILGEPEMTFLRLVEKLEKHNTHHQLKGIAYREATNKLHIQHTEAFEDLDSIPFPERTAASLSIGEVNIMGSRGCYGNCTFCYINAFVGSGCSKWRGRSPENIVAEIDEVIAKTGMRSFYFTDPNFFGPGKQGQERALKLASLLKPRNIQFGIEARVNDIHDTTIKALVEAGLKHILIGLESGKEESLKRLNKMTTVEENEKALKILRNNGIKPNVGFIMFEPDSTIEDLRINYDFLKRNEILNSLDITVNVLYHHQIILQGTKSYKELKQQGRLKLSSLSTYEGSADYKNPQVARFAVIMREITNCIFGCYKTLWCNDIYSAAGMKEKYDQVNRMLINVFEETLALLEKGSVIDESYKLNTIQASKEYIYSKLS
ncbi:B12-binding domain-containing radical SAM protein [Clostridium formicaceticum]|uniref:B12-binding domain-containing radical SAM protein n=1 Tax=Clostridium formicaceticum TaxID=1497 RepID=A0AAC9RLC6_9CLOT|nr:radical SAM protein [Clostridium formicaceticum]AOY77158.1 B12-binding domain-containing radical SAM protein [Clostridium formicaceticum]ARE87677.1 Threonylcarbamoyladenosine tRNA methylthiotransferase MtaB [Clostridium formicaceticum]